MGTGRLLRSRVGMTAETTVYLLEEPRAQS